MESNKLKRKFSPVFGVLVKSCVKISLNNCCSDVNQQHLQETIKQRLAVEDYQHQNTVPSKPIKHFSSFFSATTLKQCVTNF